MRCHFPRLSVSSDNTNPNETERLHIRKVSPLTLVGGPVHSFLRVVYFSSNDFKHTTQFALTHSTRTKKKKTHATRQK